MYSQPVWDNCVSVGCVCVCVCVCARQQDLSVPVFIFSRVK